MPYSVGELAVIPMEVTRSEGYSTRYLVRSDHRLRRAVSGDAERCGKSNDSPHRESRRENWQNASPLRNSTTQNAGPQERATATQANSLATPAIRCGCKYRFPACSPKRSDRQWRRATRSPGASSVWGLGLLFGISRIAPARGS